MGLETLGMGLEMRMKELRKNSIEISGTEIRKKVLGTRCNALRMKLEN